MAKKEVKNQHWVPQFYLSNFSPTPEKKRIPSWNVNLSRREKIRGICNQACGTYFYGEDQVVEHYLELVENKVAPIIKRIINEETLPIPKSEDFLYLLFFLALQMIRTPKHQEKKRQITCLLAFAKLKKT